MRPRLTLRLRVRKQMHATVWMRAVFIATERRCAKNVVKPTQIIGPRKTIRRARRPVPAKSFDFIPALFPIELRENIFRLSEKFGKRRGRWKKLNFLEAARDLALIFRARAKFTENFDVIVEDAAVSVAQLFFDFQDRHLRENLGVNGVEKLGKIFQPWIFL